MITKCPNCKGDIEVREDPAIGLQLLCRHCSTEFVVTWLFPLTLDLVDNNATAYRDVVNRDEVK
jgi:hypothetical protein